MQVRFSPLEPLVRVLHLTVSLDASTADCYCCTAHCHWYKQHPQSDYKHFQERAARLYRVARGCKTRPRKHLHPLARLGFPLAKCWWRRWARAHQQLKRKGDA